MKTNITILLIIILFSSCGNMLVRISNVSKKRKEVIAKDKVNLLPIPYRTTAYKPTEVKNFNDILIQEINKQNLLQLIKSSAKPYKYLVIYTNGCQGTPSEFKYLKKSDSLYGNRIQFILISSDNIAPYLNQLLQKKLFNNEWFYPTYIVGKDIKSFVDDRRRGEILRNQICEECKTDIIGVPYVLLFDEQNKILFHGYRGFRNTLPEDILKYFLEC